MRRNYGQANRGTATPRPRAGASRRRPTESYGSTGHSSRGGMRRGPQPTKKSNQNVIIGIVVGCAAILLIVVLVAMSGSGSGSDLEDKLQEGDPGTYEPSTETGKIVDSKPTETEKDKKNSENPVISNPDNTNNGEEDDDDWSEKDDSIKPNGFGNRGNFGR